MKVATGQFYTRESPEGKYSPCKLKHKNVKGIFLSKRTECGERLMFIDYQLISVWLEFKLK